MSSLFFVDQSLAPLRGEPRDMAEQVSTLIFGDVGEVLDRQGSWRKLRLHDDGYEGWADEKQFIEVDAETLDRFSNRAFVKVPLITVSRTKNSRDIPLRLHYGCQIPLSAALETGETCEVEIGSLSIEIQGDLLLTYNSFDAEKIMALSEPFIGTPYAWGGKSLWGIDCSGFTQMVYKMGGISLPRDSSQQCKVGTPVSYSEKLPGDLAFFHNEKGNVTHTGIVCEEDTIRHAHGWVREDKLEPEGIIQVGSGKLSHSLHSIIRINSSTPWPQKYLY